ncbi:hypothetical protein MTO96_039626 [Rhipicephalus appendiculatus]
MFGSKTSLWKLVEFVTHYKTLGARRSYFYDLDMPSGVRLLLARLQSSGVDMTLVPFKLIASTDDVHACGQMPALYDCIFRSMSTTEYYIHVDLDQLIVPARHYSIPVLVQDEERKRNDVGSIVVSHSDSSTYVRYRRRQAKAAISGCAVRTHDHLLFTVNHDCKLFADEKLRSTTAAPSPGLAIFR